MRTYNPFDVNGGYTLLSQGNASLGNAELEGSIAAFGSIQSTKQNYPVIHAAAGEADYRVPTVDGTPVRILARSFVGNHEFEVTNRDDSHTISADSPEKRASVKLVDISNVRSEPRGGGNDGTDFLRVINTQATEGMIDLKATPYTPRASRG